MKNVCYELAKLLYEEIEPDRAERDIHFASGVGSLNDLRRALAGLRSLSPEKSSKAIALLEELEQHYKGKSLFRQINDIRNNLAGILRLFLRTKGVEVPAEEEETA